MATHQDIDALLAEVDIEMEQKEEEKARRASDSRQGDRGRERNGDRRDRESNGDRRRSRDRDQRRRDDSRPRSGRGADTDQRGSTRRSSSREGNFRGRGDRNGYGYGRRGSGNFGGDHYSGGGRGGGRRSRSPRRDRTDKYRERNNSRDRGDHRGGRPMERRDSRRAEKTASPEPTEDDRDKRTIFVQQISARAETRHLRNFFEVVGPVVEAQIVKDRVTHRSKGVGYVEFKHEESVAKALDLTGKKLKGVPIIAQLTEAEKNRAARPSEGGGGIVPGTNGAPFHRLYVGNIHFSISEEDLKTVFEPFGDLENVTLQRDEAPPCRSKGYGFVQYQDPANAKQALAEMNGFELAGRQIRVGLGSDKFTPETTASLLRNFTAQSKFQGSAFSGAGGRGAYAGGTGGSFNHTHGKDDRGVSGASALDDSDVAGVNFKTYDRAKLMNALSRRDDPIPASPGGENLAVRPRVPVVDKPMASKCIKIENAFDADEEQKTFGNNWVKDLEHEIKIECEKKYGKVVHIAVDSNSEGEVYVKYDSVTGGEKAMQGLNGRNFNSRMIRASYVVDKIYNSLWGAAASKF